MNRARLSKVMMAMMILALVPAAPVIAHENHAALGAGPEADNAGVMPGMEGRGGMAGDAMDDHGMAAAEGRDKSFGKRLTSWLGRLHSVAVHFPIAMIVGAFLVELFGLWRQTSRWRDAARTMLLVGAVGALVATVLGWFAGGFYLYDRNPVLTLHRWLGTLITAATLLLAWIATRPPRLSAAPRRLYWWLLSSLTIAVAIQGFLGGTFVHGGLWHLAF